MRRYWVGVFLSLVMSGCAVLPGSIPEGASPFIQDGRLCWVDETRNEAGEVVASAMSCEELP